MTSRFRLSALVAAALMLPALVAAQATLYRWVDKDGKVHYSDTPPTEPAKSLTQKRLGGGYATDASQLPYATQVAIEKFPVTLFMGADCGDPCKQGRELLVKRGIPFSERDAQVNKDAAEALVKLVGGMFAPVLTVGSNTVKGYEERAWHSALDNAGYPRTVLPGQLRPRPPEPPAAPPAPAATPEPEKADAPPPAPEAVAEPK